METATPTVPDETEIPDNGVRPEVTLPGEVQDRETFASVLMARVSSQLEEEPEKDVVWRWTFTDRFYLALFCALAKRYRLEVFKLKGTRGYTIYVRGPRNLIWDLKRFAWEPLVETIQMAIGEYFEGVVAAESGVELDLDIMDHLPVEEGKIKPSRIETEK